MDNAAREVVWLDAERDDVERKRAWISRGDTVWEGVWVSRDESVEEGV